MTIQDLDRPEASLQLRDLHLVEEIAHRVLNDYAEVIAFLRQASASEFASTELALKSAADSLWKRAQLHRALLAPVASGEIELCSYLEQVCAALCQARLTEQGVSLTLAMDEIVLNADRCWLVGLILAELINNASCLGLSGRPGAIEVRLGVSEQRLMCTVSYRTPPQLHPCQGRGRRIIHALADELGGTLEWSLQKNQSVACLDVPLQRPDHALPIWQEVAPAARLTVGSDMQI